MKSCCQFPHKNSKRPRRKRLQVRFQSILFPMVRNGAQTIGYGCIGKFDAESGLFGTKIYPIAVQSVCHSDKWKDENR